MIPTKKKEIFDEAEREIKDLLSYDSLKRFMNSRQYNILVTRRELLEKFNFKPRLSASFNTDKSPTAKTPRSETSVENL